MINLATDVTKKIIKAACAAQNISELPKVILGFSGGPDSVFLLHVLALLQDDGLLKVIAAHLDHEWRVNSGADVEFCKQLCSKLNIEFLSAKASQLEAKIKFNGSCEEVGRAMRRCLFENVLTANGAHFIMLAHHAQDQQETFFMRLMRGTTLSGLRCMDYINGKYIRPLLEIDKDEIVKYLDQNQIKYLIDETNQSDKYLRNRIRKYVIPAAKKCDLRFNSKFQSSLSHLKQEDDFLKILAKQKFDEIFTVDLKPNLLVGDLNKFLGIEIVLQRRIVLEWLIKEGIKFQPSLKYIDEILRFLNSLRGGAHKIGCETSIVKKGKKFFITH